MKKIAIVKKCTFVVHHTLNHRCVHGLEEQHWGSKTNGRGIRNVRELFRELIKNPEGVNSMQVGFHFFDQLIATVKCGEHELVAKSDMLNISRGYYPNAKVFTLRQVARRNPELAEAMRKCKLRYAFVPDGGRRLVPCKYLKRHRNFITAERVFHCREFPRVHSVPV